MKKQRRSIFLVVAFSGRRFQAWMTAFDPKKSYADPVCAGLAWEWRHGSERRALEGGHQRARGLSCQLTATVVPCGNGLKRCLGNVIAETLYRSEENR